MSKPNRNERIEGSSFVPAPVPAPKQYDFMCVPLEEKASVDHPHHPSVVALAVASEAANGWELVQIYSVIEPRNAMLGTTFLGGVYGLFRREIKEESCSKAQ